MGIILDADGQRRVLELRDGRGQVRDHRRAQLALCSNDGGLLSDVPLQVLDVRLDLRLDLDEVLHDAAVDSACQRGVEVRDLAGLVSDGLVDVCTEAKTPGGQHTFSSSGGGGRDWKASAALAPTLKASLPQELIAVAEGYFQSASDLDESTRGIVLDIGYAFEVMQQLLCDVLPAFEPGTRVASEEVSACMLRNGPPGDCESQPKRLGCKRSPLKRSIRRSLGRKSLTMGAVCFEIRLARRLAAVWAALTLLGTLRCGCRSMVAYNESLSLHRGYKKRDCSMGVRFSCGEAAERGCDAGLWVVHRSQYRPDERGYVDVRNASETNIPQQRVDACDGRACLPRQALYDPLE